MTPAAALTNSIRLATSKVGARLFVTTVGKFWAGQCVGRLPNGDTVIRNARIVSIGTKGQSDLGGWISVVVTPDMVGTTVAVFVGVEVKTPSDRVTSEQLAYIDAVNRSGGRAGVARSPDDAVRIVGGG